MTIIGYYKIEMSADMSWLVFVQKLKKIVSRDGRPYETGIIACLAPLKSRRSDWKILKGQRSCKTLQSKEVT